MIHENYHLVSYQDALAVYEGYFLGTDATQINCNVQTTTTCQAVESYWSSSLETDIKDAFYEAWLDSADSEEGAWEAAQPCFTSLAYEICYVALMNNWEYCESCVY